MTLPVFVVPDLGSAHAGATLEVEGEEARHAVVVRRTAPG